MHRIEAEVRDRLMQLFIELNYDIAPAVVANYKKLALFSIIDNVRIPNTRAVFLNTSLTQVVCPFSKFRILYDSTSEPTYIHFAIAAISAAPARNGYAVYDPCRVIPYKMPVDKLDEVFAIIRSNLTTQLAAVRLARENEFNNSIDDLLAASES